MKCILGVCSSHAIRFERRAYGGANASTASSLSIKLKLMAWTTADQRTAMGSQPSLTTNLVQLSSIHELMTLQVIIAAGGVLISHIGDERSEQNLLGANPFFNRAAFNA